MGPLTGVDRVERAYLTRLLAQPEPAFALIRTSIGFVLLDRAGMATFAGWLRENAVPARRDRFRLLRRRQSELARRAEAAVAALALARCHRLGLPRMLQRHLPPGSAYLNVGHSNLTPRALAGWRAVPGARIAVLIHDTIPLDLPESQRPGQSAAFRARLAAVSASADLVIHVSAATRMAAEAHLARLGRVPPGLVAHPGIEMPQPDIGALPPGLPPEKPWFVALGTIEPRKNHALLLDIWDRFATEDGPAPRLLILGRRGWNNEAVFRRLDQTPVAGGLVREIAGLPDAAVAALLRDSAGLLMPSFAEGYGMPVVEAAALGVPVLASDLPVYREVLGDFPVYLRPDDLYSWSSMITRMSEAAAAGSQATRGRTVRPPSWDEHFNIVFTMT